MTEITDEKELVGIAHQLGASRVPGWSAVEQALLAQNRNTERSTTVTNVRRRIRAGEDPLGEMFCAIRSSETRRTMGATYTPQSIANSMLDWFATNAPPERVVDPGLGSGRFLVEAGFRFPDATLVGIELDPVAAMLARANIAVHGFEKRTRIAVADYREFGLPAIGGPTLFIGNPPYVRHHLISSEWKNWLSDEARRQGLHASQLAGLHVYFYLATVAKASPGDFGSFITASEWLDVNYGKLIRDLFLGQLGGKKIVVVEPTAMPFPDAATTAVITQFAIASKPRSVRIKRIQSLSELDQPNGYKSIRRERIAAESRWSHLTRPPDRTAIGYVELGELFRVHRGQVTGANRFWITGRDNDALPMSVVFPCITRAKELFTAGTVLNDDSSLRCVIDIPPELDGFEPNERRQLDRFLKKARTLGIHRGYIASNRKAWWSVGLRTPAPILATYMARRAPAFVRNRIEARHINIAHGLYPREDMTQVMIKRLIQYLSKTVTTRQGRTYAGGLTKFEPREMERLVVPGLELLRNGDA